MTRLTLALILCAFPALAEDPGWNGDPPVKPEPPTVTPEPPQIGEPVTIIRDGESPYDPYARTYFATCFCDGRMTVAWGFETQAFRRQAAEHQCRVLNEKRRCAITDQEYGAGEGKK